jgi:HPt (histidine-containing phosphotransfer) domain-containing protein
MGTQGAGLGKPLSPAIAALVPRFIARRQRDAAAVRACLENGDFESIVRIGHNLRGNGPSYGFPEVADLGERMEAAARSMDAGGVREQVERLEDWFRRVGEPS